jgi:forkhead protein FKH
VKPQTPEPTPADDNDSSLVDAGANQDLVDAVISCLAVPKEPTVAMTEFANTKPGFDTSVQAYAKIAGRTWTYFVKTMRVNIGRPREESEQTHRQDLQSSPVPEDSGIPVDIDLGPSKYVSRHHASIYYDDGKWCVMVNGRNGIRVNNSHIKRGQSTEVSCGDVVEVSNTQMMFITPEQEPTIDPIFINRAKKMVAGEEDRTYTQERSQSDSQGPHTRGSLRGSDPIQTYLPPGQVPLAPAPPYFKRQTTPKTERTQDADRRTKQSPLYNRGMMMESTEEIDFSKDASKDLKPPYSYATMIAQAIFSSDEEKLTLNNIYQWIMEKYAFYRYSQTGWQVSSP